jgi:cysteine desulfurase/selenocysteine lyase
MDISHLRADFPMLKKSMHGKPLVYLDSAATAQKPEIVIESIASFYREHYGTVHRAIYELAVDSSIRFEKVREQTRDFLHAAKASEIIFTRGTTESINLVASSFGKAFIKPGDEIIITEMDHHSNIVPWQMLCEERGATLRVVPFNDQGILDLDAYHQMLSSKTQFVSIAHISNTLGTLNPVKQMIKAAHDVGAYVLIDGAQAAPHRPVDVQDLDADFYVFSVHKAYGPTGIGVLYGKEALLNAMPPYQGGGDMIETVTFEKTTYNVLPLKFEAGTPLIAEVMGLGAALDYLQKIGMESIHLWEQELLKYATEKFKELPKVKIIGQAPEKGGVISFIVEGAHPLDIGTMLDLKGIAIRTGHLCAQPVMRHYGVTSLARISFGLYTSKQDLDIFFTSLKSVIHQLT